MHPINRTTMEKFYFKTKNTKLFTECQNNKVKCTVAYCKIIVNV